MTDEIINTPAKGQGREAVRNFATIGALYEDGVSLIFDGETEPTQKHYLCNRSVYFAPGDRVKIIADSGTYVVEYVVGAPQQSKLVGIPAGGSAGQVLAKKTAADYDAAWSDAQGGLPAGGSKGQVLTKNSSVAGDASWATPATTAEMATNVVNQYNTAESFAIQLRATSASAFEIRRGPYGAWYKLTTG